MTEPTGPQYDPRRPPAQPTGPMYETQGPQAYAPQPQRRPWFGPKRFGYGIGPQTWQGWAIMLALPFVALAFVGAMVLLVRLISIP